MNKGMILAPFILTGCISQPVMMDVDLDECDLTEVTRNDVTFETYQCSDEPLKPEHQAIIQPSKDMAFIWIEGPLHE